MNFWKKVDEELNYLGKSRKELALEADFDASYIPKGITRNSVPAADLALRISHALNVTPEYLLDMEQKSDENKKTAKMNKKLRLYEKYEELIKSLEQLPSPAREKFSALAEEIAGME